MTSKVHGSAGDTVEILGEVIQPSARARSSAAGRANLKPGYHSQRRPEYRLRMHAQARRVYGDAVGDFIGGLLEGLWRKHIPPAVAKMILTRLLPDKQPRDITTLPEQIETALDWVNGMRRLYQLRREQRITDDEWAKLRQGITDHWRAVHEGTVMAGRREL